MSFYLCYRSDRAISVGVGAFYTAIYIVFVLIGLFIAARHWYFAFWIAPVVTSLMLVNVLFVIVVDPEAMTVHEAQYTQALIVVDAFIVPLYILQLFELTYMVHKNRAVNFCCIKLEEYGLRRARGRLTIVRAVVQGLIFALLVLTLVSQSLKVAEITADDMLDFNLTLCSRGVFAPYIYDENDEYFLPGGQRNLEIFVDFLQPLVLLFSASYLGVLLWRYGTFYAFKPSSTYLNPWVALSIFTLAFFVSMFFYTSFSAFTVAFLILQVACFLICKLVMEELRAFHDLDEFLRKSQGHSTTIEAKRNLFDARGSIGPALTRHSTSSKVADMDHDTTPNHADEHDDLQSMSPSQNLYDVEAPPSDRTNASAAPQQLRVSRQANADRSLRHSHSLPVHLSDVRYPTSSGGGGAVVRPSLATDSPSTSFAENNISIQGIYSLDPMRQDNDSTNVEDSAPPSPRLVSMSFDLVSSETALVDSHERPQRLVSEATIIDDDDEDSLDNTNSNNENENADLRATGAPTSAPASAPNIRSISGGTGFTTNGETRAPLTSSSLPPNPPSSNSNAKTTSLNVSVT